jgi:hypothetical protein
LQQWLPSSKPKTLSIAFLTTSVHLKPVFFLDHISSLQQWLPSSKPKTLSIAILTTLAHHCLLLTLVPFSNGCHHQNPKHSLSIAILSHNHKTMNLNSCISLEQQKGLAYIIQKHKRGEAKKKHWAGCGVVENCNSSPSSSSKCHDDDRNKGTRATTTTMSTWSPKLLCVLFQYATWSLLPGTQWYQFWMIIILITTIITILCVLFQYTRNLLPGTNTNS